MGPRIGGDQKVKKKNTCPCRKFKFGRPIVMHAQNVSLDVGNKFLNIKVINRELNGPRSRVLVSLTFYQNIPVNDE